jgi:hypothetical protein
MSSAGDQASSTNKGKTTIWSASAMMASIMAARKREPGEIVTVSSVTPMLLSCLIPILTDAARASGRIPIRMCRRMRGTGFQSTAGGMRGTLLPYRTCSTHCHTSKTTGLLSEGTSRRAGTGSAARMGRRSSPQARDQQRWDCRRSSMATHYELV